MIWKTGQHSFRFPRPAVVMGILNVTPDSFSDGGAHFETAAAVEHGLRMAGEGAEIIDVGGESTRPKADPVSEQEELRRVIPVIEKLSERAGFVISIDTQKPKVAREALRAGASIINDIAANRETPEMWEIAAEAGAGYVLMHMKGTPRTMQEAPEYKDVVKEVGEFFDERIRGCLSAGMRIEQLVVDVGIGFGKRMEHNLQLLAELNRFKIYQRPMLLGASRKSFIGKLQGAQVNDRVPGSIACALWAVQNGVQIIRAHDVAETAQAIRVLEAILETQGK